MYLNKASQDLQQEFLSQSLLCFLASLTQTLELRVPQEKRNKLMKEYRRRQWDLFIRYMQDYLTDRKILDALDGMFKISVIEDDDSVFERSKKEVSCPMFERLKVDMRSGNRSTRSSGLYQTAGCQPRSATSRP
jgi:hypothetical protein